MASSSAKNRRGLGVVFWLSVAWIGMLVVFALFRDWLPIRDPEALGIRTREIEKFERPGFNALLGGDGKGRDLFSRVVFGTRPAMILGLTVTILAATIGSAIGVAAGYLRGFFDGAASLAVDISLAFPALVLLIAVRTTFGNSLTVFIILFTASGIPTYARIVRGAALSLVEREFVDAAVAMGATKWRVLWRELAPNIMLPVLSFAVIGFAAVIVAEGALAFLDLSIDQTTWGKLIAEGSGEIANNPHAALLPATVMFLTILSFNLVGDGIRDLYAPREVATQRRLHSDPLDSDPLDSDSLDGDAPDGDALGGDSEPSTTGLPLSIGNLATTLHTANGEVRAVDDVSLRVAPGEALGVVGESGSGKTMILRSIVGAFPLGDVTRNGTVTVAGVDMLRAEPDEIRTTLGTRVGMISQNPLTALNPVRRIDAQVMEPMLVHRDISKAQARTRALELMKSVGIPAPEQRLREYPHQLSGGMRQRVTIAIALANDPELLLADEPTTALDVTVQDQILRLLSRQQHERNMALVLVTHDLAVVKGFTDRVAIVYAGQVVESGSTTEIFARPKHRYTLALLNSMPNLDLESHSELASIEGTPPSLLDLPSGCRFAARCPAAQERCVEEAPPISRDDEHMFRCHFPVEQDELASSSGVSSGR